MPGALDGGGKQSPKLAMRALGRIVSLMAAALKMELLRFGSDLPHRAVKPSWPLRHRGAD